MTLASAPDRSVAANVAIAAETPLQDDVRAMVAALNAYLMPLTPREFQFQLTAEQMAGYQGPTYAMFELEFGVRMVRAEEKIRAVAADATQARLLAVAAGTPLLSVERVAYTYNDVPMELRRGLYRTDDRHYRNALS